MTTDARSPDPRVQRSRRAVLTTALELLNEGGVGRFSIDEVARRSGVAKTTIYRHWPDRDALVLDACTQMTVEPQVPDTGTLVGDLTAVLVELAGLLAHASWASVLPSIIDTAEHDPEFAAVHSRIQAGHARPLHEILQRAAGRGESVPSDHATTVAALLGPLFYRRWFSREHIDREFIDVVVARAVGA